MTFFLAVLAVFNPLYFLNRNVWMHINDSSTSPTFMIERERERGKWVMGSMRERNSDKQKEVIRA
jgi:hypothetical protein